MDNPIQVDDLGYPPFLGHLQMMHEKKCDEQTKKNITSQLADAMACKIFLRSEFNLTSRLAMVLMLWHGVLRLDASPLGSRI